MIPQVIAVVGATATGKSDLALDLAEQLDGEVINADAMQLYRGMDIGTNKLPVGERRGVPHHLLDVLEVTDEATLADFQERSEAAIVDVLSRGRVPILAGGSGLYVRAALDHLEIPPTDPVVRARLEAQAQGEGGVTPFVIGCVSSTQPLRRPSSPTTSGGSSVLSRSSRSPGGPFRRRRPRSATAALRS